MSEYLVMLKIPLEAIDDPDARMKAQEILKDIKVPEGTNMKLQRLEKGQAPVGVALFT